MIYVTIEFCQFYYFTANNFHTTSLYLAKTCVLYKQKLLIMTLANEWACNKWGNNSVVSGQKDTIFLKNLKKIQLFLL